MTKFILCILILTLTLTYPASANEPDTLRPGDMVSILLPGEVAFDKPFQVDLHRRLLLPEVGSVSVAGLSQAEAFERIQVKLNDVFKGFERTPITLKERRLLITVMGYVKHPGLQDLNESSTVQMAINSAGGLKVGAQLDKVQIRRGEQVIVFNYKKYLDTGDPSLIPFLKSMDHVFVPASPLTGNVEVNFDARTLTAAGDASDKDKAVIVFGEVHRPGSFAYKGSNSIVDMIMRAGGVTRYAAVDKIKIISNGVPMPFNLRSYLDTGRSDLLPSLIAGDTIYVPQIVERVQGGERTIRIIGSVARPGRYDFTKGMSLLDLIAISGAPKAEADTAHVQVLKTDKAGSVNGIPFNLKKFFDKGGNMSDMPVLAAGDTVVVPELPKDPNDNRSQWVRQSSESSIYVFGGVTAPGRYGFNEELNFLDILAAAQGPTANADLRNVKISHRNEDLSRVSNVDLSLYFRTGDESMLPRIEPEDVIFIPQRSSDWRDTPKETSVRILGAINKPGRYVFDDTLTILDVLAESGGPTTEALQEKIIVVSNADGEQTSRLFDLVQFARSGDFSKLPVLRAGDTIYIPNKEEGAWSIASTAIRDAVSVLSLVHLASGL